MFNYSDEIDLYKVCRSCLLILKDMKSLDDEYTKGTCVREVFRSITSLECYTDPPTHICLNCFSELIQSYKFVLKCRESDKKIRNYLNNIKNQEKNIVDNSENTQFVNVDIKVEHDLEMLTTKSHTEIQTCLDPNIDIVKNEIDFMPEMPITYVNIKNEFDNQLENNIIHGEKPYSCTISDKLSTEKSNLDDHCKETPNLRLHTGEKPYSCTSCDKTTNLTLNRQTHTGGKPYSCTSCVKTTNLTLHRQTHTGGKPYSCTSCDKTNLTHTREKPYSFGQNTYSKNESILKQQLTAPQPQLVAPQPQLQLNITKEKPYSCTACDKSFSHKCHLSRHLQTHAAKKSYPCTICDHVFDNKASILRHTRIVHTQRKLIPIRPAEKPRLSNENSLVQPQILETGTSSTNVTNQTEKKHLCTVCGMSFMYKESLTRHRHTHKVPKVYPCTLCTKSFFNNTRLTQHIRTHTGEKPYTCTVCGKSFTHVEYLNRHRQLHGKGVQYPCCACKKSFSAKASLTRHMRTVHGNGATISTPIH